MNPGLSFPTGEKVYYKFIFDKTRSYHSPVYIPVSRLRRFHEISHSAFFAQPKVHPLNGKGSDMHPAVAFKCITTHPAWRKDQMIVKRWPATIWVSITCSL